MKHLPTLPEYLSSLQVFAGFVLLDLQFSVRCCVGHCLFFCFFSFDRCIACPIIYGFQQFIWHLQTFFYFKLQYLYLLHVLSLLATESLLINQHSWLQNVENKYSFVFWLLHCLSSRFMASGYCFVIFKLECKLTTYHSNMTYVITKLYYSCNMLVLNKLFL